MTVSLFTFELPQRESVHQHLQDIKKVFRISVFGFRKLIVRIINSERLMHSLTIGIKGVLIPFVYRFLMFYQFNIPGTHAITQF